MLRMEGGLPVAGGEPGRRQVFLDPLPPSFLTHSMQQKANEESGAIGAGIVATFVMVVCVWYGSIWLGRKWQARQDETDPGLEY